MEVAIEYTAGVRQGGGVGRYTRGLVAGLAELGTPHTYTLVCSRDVDVTQPSLPANFHRQTLPLSERLSRLLWQRLRLPLSIEWFIPAVDIYHSPDFVLPPLRSARGIVTVHDLSFLATPHYHEPRLQRYLAAAVPRAVERADHVLADSRHTRRALIERLGVPAERVSVVYPGVEGRFRPYASKDAHDGERLQEARERYSLDAPFILSVGTLEPRKNYDGLLHAYATLVDAGYIPHRLVIAGGQGWRRNDQELQALTGRLGVRDRVQFAGFVPDRMLPALYNLADLVVYPSHYEGFGLPVLEAMACGTPVVTSRNTSLPEVGSDAVVYVEDSSDTEALAAAIARTLDDSALRERLRTRGLERAQRFTWTRSARHVVRIYEAVGS